MKWDNGLEEGAIVPTESVSTELGRALRFIEQCIRDGVEHGHFEFTIRCELTNAGRRRLTFACGKSHKFVIGPDEL